MKNFLFIFLNIGIVYAQVPESLIVKEKRADTIYANEYNQPISKSVFDLKINTDIYYGIRFDTDSVVLDKLRYSYYFGSLHSSMKSQLFKLLSSRNKVDTTKMMVIHYEDTLKKKESFPTKNIIVYIGDSITHRHVLSYSSFIKTNKKCIAKFDKLKQTQVYHFYDKNEGHPETYRKMTW